MFEFVFCAYCIVHVNGGPVRICQSMHSIFGFYRLGSKLVSMFSEMVPMFVHYNLFGVAQIGAKICARSQEFKLSILSPNS